MSRGDKEGKEGTAISDEPPATFTWLRLLHLVGFEEVQVPRFMTNESRVHSGAERKETALARVSDLTHTSAIRVTG